MDVDVNTKPKLFRFFNIWTLFGDFHNIVQGNWQNGVKGTAIFEVVTRLKALKNCYG